MEKSLLTSNSACGKLSAVRFYQTLAKLGLVRVKVFKSGTFWWAGKVAAQELIDKGEAEAAPLSDEELQKYDAPSTLDPA